MKIDQAEDTDETQSVCLPVRIGLLKCKMMTVIACSIYRTVILQKYMHSCCYYTTTLHTEKKSQSSTTD